jgi:two-component system alkaline phosphatase synthesis response regulator PhoP
MPGEKILIIDDETPIADLLAYGLGKESFSCKTSGSGSLGLVLIEEFRPDLLILDWMLPDIAGLDICKMVTEKYNIPIIMLTAKSSIEDKVLGLEFGADDYITKPFDMREVAARVKNVFRRRNVSGNHGGDRIQIRDVLILKNEHRVLKRGQEVDLTPKEYGLLLTLCENRGIVFSRSRLLDLIWGYEFAGDTRTVDMHIQRIRKKLDLENLITTVFGVGYRMENRE